jgi:3-hydroxyacyl-[acyl-carrier-protein] dehydratase
METVPLNFDSIGIQQCQQNKYPLLFVDRITKVIPGERASGLKCFTYNEWFFPAHFEDDPNVPGFIQVEALVQVFIMTFLCMDKYKGKKTNFISIDKVKFKKKIVPGDTFIVEATLNYLKRGIAKGRAEGFVDGEFCCSAEFMVTIPDIFNGFNPSNKVATTINEV